MVAPLCWAALMGWGNAATFDLSWPWREPLRFIMPALIYPVLEEMVFRGGVQPWLQQTRYGRRQWIGVSLANLTTSILFCGLHFLAHAPLWAVLVFIPSLVFGYFRERHHTVASPILLHVFYNAGYYWMFGQSETMRSGLSY